MSVRYEVRIAKQVAEVIAELPVAAREELRAALLRAQDNPAAWPQADRYDLDDTVRVVTTETVIAHYAVVQPARHLWVFAVTTL
ncbi:hypothetical protein AB0K51_04890 [Kitasatospora sp. NPDC049285]|uniref:hypothetical protein n=1 Tax=Kitasatospora sp. NPDC049285 TaxID=3157096 RepID=UPI00341C68B9